MDIRTPVPEIYGGIRDQYRDLWNKQIETLKGKFASSVEEVLHPDQYPTDVPIIYVNKASIVEVLKFMKEASGFDYHFLADLTATDEEVSPRFEIVYQLLCQATRARIRVKVRVEENSSIPTIVSLWPAANWPEREVYDMFGVQFEGHPDLRRILMDERWVGHPLRKDYPLRGYQIFPEPMPVQAHLLEGSPNAEK